MRTIIYIAIYLLGSVICYLWIKRIDKVHNEKNTKRRRAENLFLSLFSWFLIAIALVVNMVDFIKSQFSDEEAKW
ncbi:MAG: hypothetical protein RLZZ605_205 [Bacteroidota bacterium]|jgi:glycerol-3-phosphate acyltransferase PlsY